MARCRQRPKARPQLQHAKMMTASEKTRPVRRLDAEQGEASLAQWQLGSTRQHGGEGESGLVQLSPRAAAEAEAS